LSETLLDASVLIPHLWPDHPFHEAVQRWMSRNSHAEWATCAVTQAAFVRVISNPGFSKNAVISPRDAADLLEANLAHPRHRYWRDDRGLIEAIRRVSALQSHRQVTDAYLLGLALRHKGRLATLDRGIAKLVPEDAYPGVLEVIRP
jgi:toxin-antitoxin system PIN domain toxin